MATGFQRLCVWDDEPDDKRMAEFDELDDNLSTTSAAFLGLTMGCARCHDHKFDPIPQSDYYRMLAFFRNVRPSETAKYTLDSPNYVPFAPPRRVKAWQRERGTKIKALEKELASAPDAEEKKKLREEIKRAKDDNGPFEWALAVKEREGKPLATHLLVRGSAASPAGEVEPAFLAVLGGEKPEFLADDPEGSSTGRRLAFAEWMVSPKNPLTARVMVNRLWQHHFGKGIVKTTSDFGRAGTPPTNPALLDWLASEFIRSGWSLKKMHKLILLSNAYRMSSRADNPRAQEIDPGNDLIWRQSLRRLEAEAIRDSILGVSGELNLKMGGRGFFPHLGGEVLAGASRPGLDWQKSSQGERSRRSVYTYVRRTLLVPALDTFDYSNTTSPLGERPVTTVAPQALMLLNDDFMQEQSAALANRLIAEAGTDAKKQIQGGYERALGRKPSRREAEVAADFLKRQVEAFSAIQSRMTFRPDVPISLSVEYMNQLKAADFLIGPDEGWTYYRGHWSGAYEGIRTVDRQRGPFALLDHEPMEDGTVAAKLVLDRASESGSLLFRAKAEGEEQRGYELTFDPRQQRVTLRRHGTNDVVLAQADAGIPTVKPISVRIDITGARIRAWLSDSGEQIVDTIDPQPIQGKGLVGIRTWGAALSLDDLAISDSSENRSGRSEAVHVSRNLSPIQQKFDRPKADLHHHALQSFCLLLLNLNEMIYVD